jgi:glucose-1-phosphate thymidylyltransferase
VGIGAVCRIPRSRIFGFSISTDQCRNHGGYAWLDTGIHDSLLEAASFIATLQKRQGFMVACSEEILLANKWVDAGQVEVLAQPLKKTGYGAYLLNLIRSNN